MARGHAGVLLQQQLDARHTQRHAPGALRQAEGADLPGVIDHGGVDQRRMIEMGAEQVAEFVDRCRSAVQLQASGEEVTDEIGGGFQLAHRFLQRMTIHRDHLVHGYQQTEAKKGAQQQGTQGE
ncbi:hypothetical protein D3C78_983280 [compost metagenome]